METPAKFIGPLGYRGRLQAAILDWAGTTVDFGSFAPTAVFIKLFASRGVPIQVEHARGPMGLMKKDHLRAIAAYPEVAQAWQQTHGHAMTEAEIDGLFAEFVPLQMQCLTEYAQVIPGVPQAVAEFRAMGLKVGSTTGYTRGMMEVLAPAAAANGYAPDAWVAANDVPAGRPYPWMMYQNAMLLGVFPMEACVKIGDTLVDIEEGRNAGAWTIGLVETGNMFGMSPAELQALPADEREARRQEITEQFVRAGAHYVVDSLADCPPVLAEINHCLSAGERP